MQLETAELGSTAVATPAGKPAAKPARRMLLAASVVAVVLVVAGMTALVYTFARKDSSRDTDTGNDERRIPTATSSNESAMTHAAIDNLIHLLEESGEYEHAALTNSTYRRSLLLQCPFERLFGDCYNRQRANVVIPPSSVSNGWNAEAGSRPGGFPDYNFFANNAWTPYEFGTNGLQNGYITHFIDTCHGCRSTPYSNSVQALQAIESRPFMFRLHETTYEEYFGSQDPVSDPIGGYLSGRQRYVLNGAGIGAPEELVLQTFLGGSTTTSFRTRGPGFFFYYTFESVARGRVLVVVDSSPPPCCATTS